MMLKKWKGLLSFVICISILCTVMPITGYAEDNAVSVTFGGNTEYYTAIDAAWAAAVSLDTTAENKATIKLLADCTAENTLTNTEDYLVLDTNGRTLTTPDATYTQNNDVICGISAEGGSLEIIGNGTITGISSRHFARAILLISGGKVYADGVTIHNTGTTGSNAVLIKGGEFHLLNSYLISASEYALYADTTDSAVYLYSGKIESTGRAAMIAEKANVKICCSDKPLYFINNKPTKYWEIINDASYVHLEENARMDIEYSNNPDGSNSTLLENVTEITNAAISEKGYLKIQTSFTPSYLFDTRASNTLLSKIKTDGVTELDVGAFTAVHFVDLADYDMTNITYSDYSASGDGSVKAWVDGTELYIGGYRKIIAGKSLAEAFRLGTNINAITGMEMLDTSNVTDMSYMFYKCGSDSTSFTLDLGDNFDTSNVTSASCMFWACGQNSPVFTLNLGNKFDTSKVIYMNNMFNFCGEKSNVFTLDLGDKFDTSNVKNMTNMFASCGKTSKVFTLDLGDKFHTENVTIGMNLMFYQCGQSSEVFKELDLSGFTISPELKNGLSGFVSNTPITKIIFGKGWRNAGLPTGGSSMSGLAYSSSKNNPIEIVGATKNLRSYDWAKDNRTVTFTDNITYTVTAQAGTGGTVSGGGAVLDGESTTLTAAADNGYTFDGWYDGDTKVCETEEFVIEDTADDKTYTAKFTKDIVYYTVTAVAENGGTVTGGGTVLEGESITLTATANDGYTFDGWYDGEKVSDTAEFTVENVTADKTYTAKFTKVVSRLLNTSLDFYGTNGGSYTLMNKVKDDGVTSLNRDEFTAVHFVDLADYDMTNITYSDYSADGDGSVKAWVDGTELYIGGYGKIIAGDSIAAAFCGGRKIDSITGFEMLDTSNVTNMEGMFYGCGYNSTEFTLDLGDNFDTSKVTNMGCMFFECGYNSPVFTLDLGDKFDTSNVTSMEYMFWGCGYKSLVFTLDLGDRFDTSKVGSMLDMFRECGYTSPVFTLDLGDKFDTSSSVGMLKMFKSCGRNSKVFTELDLSGFTFTFSEKKYFQEFAADIPVTKFIFGEGWANAPLPTTGVFSSNNQTDTVVIGATPNLMAYDWAKDNRTVTFPDKKYYTVTAVAENGGTVTGGGTVLEGESITLTATANDGYTFDGWYDGETKVSDAAEFTVENVTADKTYTAKFAKDIVYYTITAVAEDGGTVAGGGEVAEGESITLTATANDGYTFDGWYDGETKVSDVAEFTVENVTADKTYTAKFTESPEIPYLKWDGTTLTLVKKEGASCRVGIVYVGGATFDADNIEWNELVDAGKEYANLNSSIGYAVYNNFTKRTPGTRGNYVAFVKYTKEDGTTTADYITYSVKDAVSFEIPGLSYNVKTKALQMKGNVESTVGVAYVGDTEFNAGDITWNDFVKAGKKYQDINGTGGYEKVLNTLDYTKTFETNGNYVAFIKYFDENLNKTLAKYYAFSVADYDSQPTDAPFAVAEEKQIVLKSNGLDVAKVTIAYIGTDDIYITNWNDFSAAAAKFSDINGKSLNQQYANPKDGSAWKQETAGWYGVYIRYIKDGKTCNSYYTVELN